MELIDVHAHVVPRAFPQAPGNNPRWPCMEHTSPTHARVMIAGKSFRELDDRSWSVARRIADMDSAGVTRQALSPMPELLSYWFAPADGLEMARWMNHSIAEMVAAAPSRFSGLGIVPLQDPALAAKELSRLAADGFCGAELGSNVNGTVLGDTQFHEVYAEAERLGLAIFVHALHPIGGDRLQSFPDLVPFTAFPLDTALSAISLIRAGVPQRYPGLRIGFSHGGGAIVPLVHRLAQGWRVTDGFNGALPEPPHVYASRFFYDSLVYDCSYLEHLASVFAPGQIVGGTDYPYAIMETDLRAFLSRVAGADASSLFHGSARRFLALT
jgi:aminocarboxymuconate-semialdehyde decarboxylase